MHDTTHETAELLVPSPPAEPVGEPSTKPNDPSRVSPEVVVKFIGLTDELESLFRDEPTAWAAIEAEIGARKARWEARHSAGRSEQPLSAPVSRRERRPFLGFDREEATYARVKPSLLESAERKWVVIVGEEVLGPFDRLSEAMGAGYMRFGMGPLFIKQILRDDLPVFLPPYVAIPCQT